MARASPNPGDFADAGASTRTTLKFSAQRVGFLDSGAPDASFRDARVNRRANSRPYRCV